MTSAGVSVKLLFGSTTGTSERRAAELAAEIELAATEFGTNVAVSIENLATFAFDSLLAPAPASASSAEVVVVLMSTHTDGVPPENCAHFLQLLEDHVHDFRVDKTALSRLHFAVVG